MYHFTLSTHQSASKSKSIGSYISFPPVFKVTWEVAPFEQCQSRYTNTRTHTHTTLVDLHTVCVVTAGCPRTHTHLLYKVGAVKSHQHAGTCCTCVACKALWDMFSDPWQTEGLRGIEQEKRAADKESLCVVCMCDCATTWENPASEADWYRFTVN